MALGVIALFYGLFGSLDSDSAGGARCSGSARC